MPIERVYLIIGADRKVRAAKRPRIGVDEIAIQLNLHFPNTWGRVAHTLDVSVPDWVPDPVTLADAPADTPEEPS